MREEAVLLICVVSLALGVQIEQNENGCPLDYTYEQLYPHENCNRFYQCFHGDLVEHRCASDLLFDITKQKCDWPQNVECGERDIPDVESEENDAGDNESENNGGSNCDPSEAPSICATDGSDGILVAHENCNQFYKCSEGLPVVVTCPSGLLYNSIKEQCDWSENVNCGDRNILEVDHGGDDDDNNNANTTCNCNPGEAPKICATEGSDGALIAHQNCNQFYKCYNGIPVALYCPDNLLYDPEKEQCEWSENVDCGERMCPDSDNQTDGNGDNDAEEDEIESGADGNGDGGNGDGTCNCNPGEAPSTCAGADSDGVLIAHENCNQFYKCSNGLPEVMDCPGELLYNAYNQQCDWPQNVECGDRVIPDCDSETDGGNDNGSGDNGTGEGDGGDTGNGDGDNGGGTCNCNPGEAPSICAGADSDGVLIAHENCNQFYKCNNGLPEAMDCPGELLYNAYKQQCDWPQNVECGDRVIPECDSESDGGNDNGSGDNGTGEGDGGDTGNGDGGNGGGTCNCNPGEAPSICAGADSDGVLIAHENCNQFYKCNNGLPEAMDCPGELLYNAYNQQCDWPQNVECGDRVIPECDSETDGGNDNGSGDNGTGEGDGGDTGNGDGDNGGGTCNCNPGEAPSICAGADSDGVLIAHENCNQFYKCNNGLPEAMDCPGELLYNAYKQQCDWPQNVECGDRVIPECDSESDGGNDNGSGDNGTGEGDGGDTGNGDGGNGGGTCNCNPGEAPSICAGADSDGVLIAHENCNQFYKCNNGLPEAMDCPGELLYNAYNQQCDWPQNVECGDRVIPECDSETDGGNDNGSGDNGTGEGDGGDSGNGDGDNGGGTCNCNPGEAPSICAGADSDGVLIAHENCNQFYKCNNGLPEAMDCPGELLYNAYKQQCDWPQNVECGDRVIPECDSESDGGNDNGSGDNGTGEGDGGDTGNGDGGNGGGTCNCNPGEAPSICAGADSDGVLIAHENCNQFYKCNNGLPEAMDCPGELLYNAYNQQCDWPQNVECGDRVIPECDSETDGGNDNGSGDNGTGEGDGGDSGNGDGDNGGGTCNCNPGEAPSICAGADSDGVLIAHENCNQFYKCNNGLPEAMDCPGELLYNAYNQQCDWPQNVECGDRVIPECDSETDGGNDNGSGDNGTGEGDGGDSGNGDGDNGGGTCNCNPGEAPSICAGADSDGVLIAHENCNQFYKCNNGLPEAMDCPGELLYNAYKQQCDWPQNVECGDRVIPECDSESDGGNDNGSGDNGTGEGDGGDTGNGDGGNGGGTCNCNPGEAPSICAGADSDGVLIAHENCNQFYKCNNGLPEAMDCPGELLYNAYNQQCDWPQNVECGDRVIPECDSETDGGNDNGSGDNGTGEGDGGDSGNGDGDNGGGTCNCNPGEAPSICAGADSDGVLIAHENCNQFYKCNNGLPEAMDCPGELLYNAYNQQCDWPQNVECGDRVIPECDSETDGGNDNGSGDNGTGEGDGGDTGNGDGDNGGGTCNCNPGEAPSICAGADSDGVLIAHEKCNQFYKCSNGLPEGMDCPGELLYNAYNQQCDWPQNVECGDRVIPECDSETDGGNDNGSGDNGTGEGDGGDTGNGDGDNGGGTCNCNPGEAPSICAGADSDGVLIAHENCNQFYKCNNGLPEAMDCPGELLYNAYNQQCDWPQNVECGDRVIPECDSETDGGNDNGSGDNGTGEGDGGDTGNGDGDNGGGTCNCNPGEAPSICAGADSDGVLIAHENCNQFYKCSNGLPETMDCPGELLYNAYKQQCDLPQNVECGDRVIPECDSETDGGNDNGSGDNGTGEGDGGDSGNGDGDNGGGTCNCNPGEAPSICAGADSDGVLIAHENCNQFYKCNNGLPEVMDCPGELLYNAYKQQCDWPQNVECGDRVIPECDSESDGGNDNESGDNGTGEGDGGDTGNGDGDNGGGTCNCNPGEAPSICAGADSDGVLIAHENCNQFYKCNNGLPEAMDCPGELLYNAYKQQCDWPQNVECGDRVIPECDSETDGGNDNGSGDNGTGEGDGGDTGNGDGGNGGGTCNCNPGEAPSICAGADSDGVLIAHENCNQFYKCNNGLPEAMDCPGELLYNAYNQQCDWPQNVECGDRVIPECDSETDGGNDNGSGDNGTGEGDGSDTTTEGDSDNNGDIGSGDNNGTCNCSPGEAPLICASSGSDNILIAHENCNQFYQCADGAPVVLTCPAGLLYDPYTNQCDWPHNVNCTDRIIPECDNDNNGNVEDAEGDEGNSGEIGNGDNVGSCNCDPSEAPAICARPGSNNILIAHENCNQFYICSSEVPTAMTCGGNLLYNPYKEECDWPENVDCGERVIVEIDMEDGNNESDTNDNNNAGNTDPSEAPTICAKDGSDGVLIAHENCNQFYICSNMQTIVLNCSDNLLYDALTGRCQWPALVDCGNRVIPEMEDKDEGSCSCNSRLAPALCMEKSFDGALIAHEYCDQFYKCANGVPVSYSCPQTLLYNPYKEICDWPQNVNCNGRTISYYLSMNKHLSGRKLMY